MKEWRPDLGIPLKGLLVLVVCTECEGTGYEFDDRHQVDCTECKGSGEIMMRIDPSALRRLM